ncbi:hypothetical protein GCM10011396_38180 [Undibacterium terreum]|uniref:Uncharacterized protein n=1 Tax=Undibacterium terreum TaxID=1224302 RepID=A0A916UUC4_9BURK|nr:hypothetical protein GCM10011396_38180 [Undibacterium terreum]
MRDDRVSLASIATSMYAQTKAQAIYNPAGGITSQQLITKFYNNVLGGMDYWTN